ncbi:MAG: hypothetical protein M0Z32_09145 [Actinomycetota bacterium]|nr:hypothetical protein [Actinomycetota bacterium]MCL6093720.1 hypothetical protein [Actinomycetota bacterium]MDA8167886.1 hypothetical protein [Actinomycetota bacterium]
MNEKFNHFSQPNKLIGKIRSGMPEFKRLFSWFGLKERERPDFNKRHPVIRLARITLFTFLLAFIAARTFVFLVMINQIPNIFVSDDGVHIHHFSFGIIVLSVVGGYLLFRRPKGIESMLAAAAYGAGLGLTYDEFGMWLHLTDRYWQRTSWDAIGVLVGLLGLIAFAPAIRRFTLRRWLLTIILLVAVAVFFYLMYASRW